MEFKKWPSIDKFSNAHKHFHRFHRHGDPSVVCFSAKIKLHGTNAAIRFHEGKVYAQKRTSDVTTEADNAGFARFVEDNISFVKELDGLIIYGEWAGPGVQKTDAVSMIAEKKFFAFSVHDTSTDTWMIQPTLVEPFTFGLSDRIVVLPYYFEDRKVDMISQEECQKFIDEVVEMVDNIGEEDPFIKAMYGVSGPGEGLVVYPVDELGYCTDASLMFKVKSDSHSVNKVKKNKVGVEKPAGVDEFIDTFFTENRFRQMVDENLDGEYNARRTGEFIKAVMQDTHKESMDEIEAADFEWKDVVKFSTKHIANWYVKECEKI